jgi:CIC family chloride channel protein
MLGRGSIRVNAIAVAATFIATAWTRLLSHPDGGPPLLRNLLPIIDYPSQSTQLRMVDLPILLLLGALAGLLAVPYQRLILGLRRRLAGWRWPAWRLLPLVGLLVGLGGALLPTGFDDPSRLAFDALEGLTSPGQALQVLVVKGAGMALAVAADAPGGMLTPTLVVGASLASLVQTVVQAVLHQAPPSLLFAGAAAMLAAITRLPLTAILLSFELSKNYDLLLPIGFCALTAIAVADQLAPSSLGETMLEEALGTTTHPHP